MAVKRLKHRRGVWIVLLLTSFTQSYIVVNALSYQDQSEEDIYKTLKTRHMQLLMEKGVCDDRGREIKQRLAGLIAQIKKEDGIVTLSSILDRLNFTRANLANFPQCAFDRPLGHKLSRYGHTKVAENIEATAEGSACPVGGIGAGSFEHTMSGNFRYWFLKSGWMVDETVWANQFHVFMKSPDTTIVQSLSTDAPPSQDALKSWQWNYPVGKGSYYALFPKSGFSYEKNEMFPAKIAVTQYSPIIPGNYRETSYPVAVFKWTAVNPSPEPVEISIMLTWQNMIGWEAYPENPSLSPASYIWDRKTQGNYNDFVQEDVKKGILFRKRDMDIKTGNAMTGTMCIAAQEISGKTQIFYHTDFDPSGSGFEVWESFAQDGTLLNFAGSRTTRRDQETAAALTVRFTLEPQERLEFPMVIAWDFPFYEFEKGVKYRKKYTEFFGATGKNAFAIASEALDKYLGWEEAIDNWQDDIIDAPQMPDWFKQALFNELYILTETSIWDAFTNLHTYLESIDYLMYGTFDVDAYSSWNLLKLWPQLERDNMRFFARMVAWEDPSYKAYAYAQVMPEEVPADKLPYYWSTNKVYGMIPHDLGSPRKRPWIILNAFDWQNGNVWKDLNPKFPLRAFRDYLYSASQDKGYLKEMFRTSVIALDTLEKRFADPRSHIPLNEGIPDQTYDTWRMKGESAYVAILWLAALKTTIKMGRILENEGTSTVNGKEIKVVTAKYRDWFEAGRRGLQKLWNQESEYFNIDAHTDDIMTDQLFGLWYSKILGLEEDEKDRIIPLGQAKKTLRSIYRKNVLGFGGGLLGAVNGRDANGRQLLTQQGDEVWVGTAYAFASNCILHGLLEEGMHTAYGVFHAVYSPFGQGYFFKTPEAYTNPEEVSWNQPDSLYGDKLFRAMKYMRPGAVWAVYEALLQKAKKK